MKKINILRLAITGYIAFLISPFPSTAHASFPGATKNKYTYAQTMQFPGHYSQPTQKQSPLYLLHTQSLKDKPKSLDNKSITQREKTYLRRTCTQIANYSRNLKNILWGAGKFSDHYLRRIAVVSLAAIGASETKARMQSTQSEQGEEETKEEAPQKKNYTPEELREVKSLFLRLVEDNDLQAVKRMLVDHQSDSSLLYDNHDNWASNNNGYLPFWKVRSPEMSALLLWHIPRDPDIKCRTKQLLHYAIGRVGRKSASESLACLEMILKRSPAADLSDALCSAVYLCRYKEASWLLSKGANPNARFMYDQDDNHTLLEAAIDRADTKTASILVEAGAQLQDVPLGQKSPLDIDFKKWLRRLPGDAPRIKKLARWLIDHRKSIGLSDRRALHLVAQDIDFTKQLIVEGLSINPDQNGHSLLDGLPIEIRREFLNMKQHVDDLEICARSNGMLKYLAMPPECREQILRYAMPHSDPACPILQQEIERRALVRLNIDMDQQKEACRQWTRWIMDMRRAAGDVKADIDMPGVKPNPINQAAEYNNPFVQQLLPSEKEEAAV